MMKSRHTSKSPSPTKAKKEPAHWTQRVQETIISAGPDGLLNLVVKGGAENGQYAYIGDVKQDKINYHSGKLQQDSIVLEVQGQQVAGFTLRDLLDWMKHVGKNSAPIMLKTVKSALLTKDLRQYLNTRFQKNSVDHDLQQTIRDNLYRRTVPCTTRTPRPGELNGVDYSFLTVDEFMALDKSGNLLESGLFDGNHYGTPKPPKDPQQSSPFRRTNSMGTLLPGQHPSSEGKRRRNRSNIETTTSPKATPAHYPDEASVPPARNRALERVHSASSLGALPANWDMAFTEDGTAYFIDHTTETTHWLDPRLSASQKTSPLECTEDELPYGWEKVEDPHYGTYFIDHVNRKTQYENPVVQAKRVAKEQLDGGSPSTNPVELNGRKSPPAYGTLKKRFFTKNPSELKGKFLKSHLRKSPRGFGFTIVGGDDSDEEFLQIKSVVPNGPAFDDGKLKTGDVLVYVNTTCVLGYTHQDVVNMFQGIPIGEQVTLEVCRGYSLPFDPNDPNTEIVTTVAVTLPDRNNSTATHNTPSYSTGHNSIGHGAFTVPSYAKSQSDTNHWGRANNHDADPRPELLSVNIEKGAMGFGFTIADSVYGQKVKQILDRPRCKTLCEGDILTEINHIKVKDLPHADVVTVLKNCPRGKESTVVVQRGGIVTPSRSRKFAAKSPKPELDDSPQSRQANDGYSNVPRTSVYTAGEKDSETAPEKTSKSDSEAKEAGTQNKEEKGKEGSGAGEEKENVKKEKEVEKKEPSKSESSSRDETDFMNPALRGSGQNEISRENGPHTPPEGAYWGSEPHPGGRNPLGEMQNSSQRDYMLGGGGYPGRQGSFDPYQDYRQQGYDPRRDNSMQGYGQSRRDYGNYSFNQFDRPDRPDVGKAPQRPMRSRTPGPELMRSRERDEDAFLRSSHHNLRSKTPTHELQTYHSISGTPDFIPASQYSKSNSSREQQQQQQQQQQQPGAAPYRGSSQTRDVPPNTSSEYSRAHRPLSNPDLMQQYKKDPYATGRLNSSQSYSTALNKSNVYPQQHTNYTNRPTSPDSGRPRKQSTSFEHEEPMTSNLSRVAREPWEGASGASGALNRSKSPSRFAAGPEEEYMVHLKRQESGFGFRIIGGTEEGSQVSVGHIVPGGAADVDGQLQAGDDILYVDNQCVIGASHHVVVQLMGQAGVAGHVTLRMRRRRPGSDAAFRAGSSGQEHFPYDVTVTRKENEGFGFVIISSVTRSGSTIGRIIENSPAERCGQLHVGDRILSVNGRDIMRMMHEDIVGIIKESGYSVTLTVGPPQDDTSSTSSSQRIAGTVGSNMTNAQAYPSHSESDLSHRSDYSPYHSPQPKAVPPPQQNSRYMPGSTSSHQSQPAIMDRQTPARSSRTYGGQPSPEQSEDSQYYNVELHRGSRGFGFSIRGGREFNNMPLYVLRIADSSAADLDRRLRVGDQLLEINGFNTSNMTHAEAIDLIQNGGSTMRLLVKRSNKPLQWSDKQQSSVSSSSSHSNTRAPSTGPMSNGPVGQSSPVNGRRMMVNSRDPFFYSSPSPYPNTGHPRQPSGY